MYYFDLKELPKGLRMNHVPLSCNTWDTPIVRLDILSAYFPVAVINWTFLSSISHRHTYFQHNLSSPKAQTFLHTKSLWKQF
jgi:hypothetical protein